MSESKFLQAIFEALVFSHDEPLVKRLCDRILDLATTQDHRTLVF
ncbi:MAG TPA: hypothetical protein V6D29_05130 [Leptolyngbyaceae cyanobacterium]